MTEKLIEQLKEHMSTFPGAHVYYRSEWQCDYFDVAGKYFALYGKNSEGKAVLTFKGKPEENELLREQYPFIVGGYHTNKTHWNSIIVADSPFTLAEYSRLLENSYHLTVAKLPKKVRETL